MVFILTAKREASIRIITTRQPLLHVMGEKHNLSPWHMLAGRKFLTNTRKHTLKDCGQDIIGKAVLGSDNLIRNIWARV